MSPDSTLPQSPRRRILVAEDEDNLRSLLKLSLGRIYEVQTVEDGRPRSRPSKISQPIWSSWTS
jgi:CheY-like chemotaxis protein